MKNKCLFCYKPLESKDLEKNAGKNGYHEKCSKKIFGSKKPPILDYTEEQIVELAKKVIKSQKTVTGVQQKLSIDISKEKNNNYRFTIVGLWGEYILKPQTKLYKNLPENEDLTMHLAQISKIKTVNHSLMRLKSGQLVYITKRVDRKKKEKRHMEDMCQLTEKLTEHKYRGSYEQIAKAIKKYSSNPGLDVTDFFEIVLFSFLTGNNDMHLKNFSLLKNNSEYNLCPAYDLVASELIVKGDDEDLALSLNGKKKKINHKDFEMAMTRSGLNKKVIQNIFEKYANLIDEWKKFIDQSFLPDSEKNKYKNLIKKKAKQIELEKFIKKN